MTYPPGLCHRLLSCENYVSELCTLTYERTVPSRLCLLLYLHPPSQFNSIIYVYHLLFQYTPLRQNDILHIDY